LIKKKAVVRIKDFSQKTFKKKSHQPQTFEHECVSATGMSGFITKVDQLVIRTSLITAKTSPIMYRGKLANTEEKRA